MIRSRSVRERQETIESVFAMMLAWETITPRGWPVDPDVKTSAARSLGPT